jgi:hypothetical protein
MYIFDVISKLEIFPQKNEKSKAVKKNHSNI